MRTSASILTILGLLCLPTVGRSQDVSWRLLSTTGGLVMAPAFPSTANVRFFQQQQLHNTVHVSSFVHPSTYYREGARAEAAGYATPATLRSFRSPAS